jgi:predicted transcriptional regulator
MSNLSNAERYRHIPTAEIIKLSDEQDLSQRKIGKLLGMGSCAVGNRLRAAGKARRPPKLTPSQLEECRQDPAYEARPGIAHRIVPAYRVVCRECGELKSELNANGNHSHLRGHHVTADEYKRKWPGARLTSFARSADQNHRQGREKTVQDLMDEFAARYLTPEEWKEYVRDQKYEERHGITKFVACRLCPLKSKTDLHNHLKTQHGLRSAEYRKQFPEALQMPLNLKHGFKRKYARERWEKISRQLAKIKTRELVPAGQRKPGRPMDEDTIKRLDLMGKLSAQGKSLRAMSLEVYPEKKHTPDAAYASVRKLASLYPDAYKSAKLRYQSGV